MHSFYTFIALDVARERAREAEQHRLLAVDPADLPDRSIRRSAAAAIAAVSRASARIARRLDEHAVLTH